MILYYKLNELAVKQLHFKFFITPLTCIGEGKDVEPSAPARSIAYLS